MNSEMTMLLCSVLKLLYNIYVDPRDLHVLSPSYPTRRSSDLSQDDAEHQATICALVHAGLGIAALHSLTTPLLRFADLVEIPITAPNIERVMGIVRRSGRSPSVAARALIELVVADSETAVTPA